MDVGHNKEASQFHRFPPGNSIHKPESVAYYADVVGASGWQLEVVQQGLKLDFEREPGAYREDNNKSALQHLEVVRSKVAEWEAGGFVERLDSQPWCCNPLSVAVKYDPVADSTKYRPVIDLSRHVNKHIRELNVKLDDLSAAEVLISPGDFLTSFDLENQFFHVKLAPECKKYFGFALPLEGGGEQFFQFNIMAYGFAPAVGVVTKLLQPVKAYLHSKGIKLSIYVDDGRVAAASEQLALEQLAVTLEVLQSCGWNVQWLKTSTTAEQRHLHLGFYTDTVSMRYFFPDQKQQVVLDQLLQCLSGAEMGQPIRAKELAQLLGRLNSMRRSHGDIVGVMSRCCQHQLGCIVMELGWHSKLWLCGDARYELLYLWKHLAAFNGQHIMTAAAKSMVVSLQQQEKELIQVLEGVEPMENLYTVSLTDGQAVMLRMDGSFQQVLDMEVGTQQRSVSSGFKELQLVRHSLEQFPEQFRKHAGGRVYWQTDSYNCFMFIKKGSKIPVVQQEVAKVKWLERQLDVELLPVWIPGDEGKLLRADLGCQGSTSTDEWGVDRRDLQLILAECGFEPEVDCMASNSNSICKQFFSHRPQVGAAGVNFFCQQLLQGVKYYCCPPVKLITRAVGHLTSAKGVEAVLVVPAWESAAFWVVLQQLAEFRAAVTWQKDFRVRFVNTGGAGSVFSRCSSMRMRVFKLKTGRD